MIEERHSVMVDAIAKKGTEILAELTPEQAELIHMAMLITGEAGELCDAIKKHTIYQRELDRENVIEELGDLEWTLERIRQILCISREETLDANIDKLTVRYPNLEYSNENAQTRADKGEGIV